ncbi:MAG TPA: hypothetical protein VIY08_10685 [Candidatus Nitrosocosmicus sp.]
MVKNSKIANKTTSIMAIASSILLLLTGTMISIDHAFSQSFHINDFKIKKFGVSHHHPFVIVKGKAGKTKAKIGDVAVEAYLFFTNKGKFGAFSNEGSYKSFKFITTKSKIGSIENVCITKQIPKGKLIFKGNKLTINGITVNKINKVMTVDINKNPDMNNHKNCILKIWSSKR